MRYMRGLNEWLERDVRDRQNELRGVYAMFERFRHDLRDMQARGSTNF
jgi:transposase